MEKIKPTVFGDPVAHTVLSAMAHFIKDSEFEAKFCTPKSETVDVVMTVNGHEVPVVKTLVDLWRRLEADVQSRAMEEAQRMVNEAALQPLADALRDAEWRINEALATVKARLPA